MCRRCHNAPTVGHRWYCDLCVAAINRDACRANYRRLHGISADEPKMHGNWGPQQRRKNRIEDAVYRDWKRREDMQANGGPVGNFQSWLSPTIMEFSLHGIGIRRTLAAWPMDHHR
jgi:hypothetical protein